MLLFKEKLALRVSHYLASFAAGTLLGTAFFDLLPEAQEESNGVDIFSWTLGGIIIFFLLERFIQWFHHHHEHSERQKRSAIWLINLGDSIHNFIDGVAIAATFLTNIPLGIVTTIAVASHEIPQEIGDFGILLHRGYSKRKVILSNILSAVAALAGAILTYRLGDRVEQWLPVFLSVTAGFFIYIAASDLIPEIHNEEKKVVALIETVLLLLGILTIFLAVSSLKFFNLPH